MGARPFLLPWVAAEAVALRTARHEARTVGVVGDGSERVAHSVRTIGGVALRENGRVDVLVVVGDGLSPTQLCRAQLLEVAERSRGELIVCEPSFAGTGLGLTMLRRIDPLLMQLGCDELPDALGGTRRRKPWEAPVTWLVGEAAAWRFCVGAEDLRAGFRSRLPRMRVEQIVLSCRRLRQRFAHAFEPLALAAEELGRRGDPDGVRQLFGELDLCRDAPPAIRGRLRRALVSCAAPQSGRSTG